ncbi:MAG: regulatory protein RecX [Bacteroidota bacterium]
MEKDSSHKRTFTLKEAKVKASRYCAYQERTQQEVRNKLYEFGLRTDEVEEALSDLIVDGFINEERYAKSFAGGKFRMKKWGRVKILQEMKQKGLSQYCINKGMEEIDETEYRDVLMALLNKKADELRSLAPYQKKHKVAQFVIRKGYEPNLVWDCINELIPS